MKSKNNTYSPVYSYRQRISSYDAHYLQIASVVILLGVFILAVRFVLVPYFTNQGEWEGLITRLPWHYTVQIDQWRSVHDDCWGIGCSPSNAYNESHYWEDTGRDKKVLSGQSCSTDSDGNMKCEPTYRNESIYDWHYYYEVNRWIHNRNLDTVGDLTKNEKPYYATPDIVKLYGDDLTCPNSQDADGPQAARLGCERVSNRIARLFYMMRIYKPSGKFTLEQQCPIRSGPIWSDLFKEKTISGLYWEHNTTIDCPATHFTPLTDWMNNGNTN